MMDMRKMLKNAGKWTWGNTFLFVFGMLTSSGYFIKHVMMIVFGIRARRILRDTNDPFDREVQKAWYLHRHAQEQVLERIGGPEKGRGSTRAFRSRKCYHHLPESQNNRFRTGI